MLNYIKSELYRVTKSKGIYLLIGICTALVIAMNLVLWYFTTFDPHFTYANTNFSFLMLLSSMQVPLCLTVTITSMVFGDEYKNRTLGNSIAFGLHPVKILFGKWIVTLLVSAIALLVVEGTLVGSAYLLLEDSGTEAFVNLLKANQGCIPLFIAGVSGYLAFVFILKNEMQATWAWVGTFVGGSIIVNLLSMKIEFFQWLNGWLAFSLISATEYSEETQEWVMIWQTSAGMTRIMMAGVLGTLVFLVLGIMGVQNRDR